MELNRLLEALAQPAAYPHATAEVTVCHTHISAVFLVGEFAYKIKKPVDLGFLDFTTLERRRHFCEEELRLNRRLAAAVYLDVVPVTLSNGQVTMEGSGEVVEWAVKMRRLPEDATFEHRLAHGTLKAALLEKLARRIASFHAAADSNPRISSYGAWDVVAANARENFEQSVSLVEQTVSHAVFERLKTRTEVHLREQASLITRRARQNVPRDTHGDLRLGHVYQLPTLAPPDDLVVVDCIEFNERFRFADPVSDMAFLAMGLHAAGRRDLARAFIDTYFAETGDDAGYALLPFYMAYRAAVRGKVAGMTWQRPEVPQEERHAAWEKSRAYWLLALELLEEPQRKPCLVLLGGLPGTGKSTLARMLAERSGFHVIRTDVVRKQLALAPGSAEPSTDSATAEGPGQGIYTPHWTERTYAECLRRAEEQLFQGQRVLVDGNFREEQQRGALLDLARRAGVVGRFLVCQASPEVIRCRLEARQSDPTEPSDANWSIYQHAAAEWEAPDQATLAQTDFIRTDDAPEASFAEIQQVLSRAALAPEIDDA